MHNEPPPRPRTRALALAETEQQREWTTKQRNTTVAASVRQPPVARLMTNAISVGRLPYQIGRYCDQKKYPTARHRENENAHIPAHLLVKATGGKSQQATNDAPERLHRRRRAAQ